MQEVFFYFFCGCAGIQLLYWTAFWAASRKKKQTSPLGEEQPISVVVCARNELKNLEELLPLLYKQSHKSMEIVVVDDRSNDGSHDFLLKEEMKEKRLKIVRVDHTPEHINGKKYALTLGIKAAGNDLLLLTDADCRPLHTEWASRFSRAFTAGIELVLGYCQYQKQPGPLNAFIRFETLLTGILYTSFARLGFPYMGVGRNLAYRKSFFIQNKGFHGIQKTTGGDDDLLVNRWATAANTVVLTGKKVQVLSVPKQSWHAFFRQKIRHLHAGKRYKLKDKCRLGGFYITKILFWSTFILLVSGSYKPIYIFSGCLFTCLASAGVVHRLKKQLPDSFQTWFFPLSDFVFVPYYVVTGTIANFIKKVKWS
ncbi:MAG: glycosyltransferase [Cytophagales bacterium]|nr:glycosyltransferase [Cytophagales bacterium]